MASVSKVSLDPEAEQLLGLVRKQYLQSPQFNGLHIFGDLAPSVGAAAAQLVAAGLVQVMTGEDYPNIHIRPWPSRRSVEAQLNDIADLSDDDYGVALYPTPLGMKGVRLPRRFAHRPYAQAMARGRGTLDLAFFQFDVLEQYRNDGRFRFGFGDAGASMGLTDEASEDGDVFERDHVGMSHIGFAYDLREYDPDDPNSPIIRRVAAFYCDLAALTPEHQRRWETYEVGPEGLDPHPLWWNSQMGHWEDAVGPFSRLFMELENLNQLAILSFGETMFRTVERPPEFGWLLRPSQKEWDEFVGQLDKLLSENLRSQFFARAGVEAFDDDNRPRGTLTRLQLFMIGGGASEFAARRLLGPLRTVRKARQAPAHAIRENITDKTFVHRQIALLNDVVEAIGALRVWLSTHPNCSGWEEKYKGMQTYMI